MAPPTSTFPICVSQRLSRCGMFAYEEPRGRSYSDPSYSAMHFSEDRAPTSPNNTEMAELKHMLQKQQVQLNQLTQGLLALQAASVPPVKAICTTTVICRHCHRLGHYARECHNEHVNSQVQQPRRCILQLQPLLFRRRETSFNYWLHFQCIITAISYSY